MDLEDFVSGEMHRICHQSFRATQEGVRNEARKLNQSSKNCHYITIFTTKYHKHCLTSPSNSIHVNLSTLL